MPDSLSTETDERLATAIGQYALSELTLGQAADKAGVSRFEMRSLLRASSVDLRLGRSDREGAEAELHVARSVQ